MMAENIRDGFYYEGKEGVYRFCGAAPGVLRCVYAQTRAELVADDSLIIDPASRALAVPLSVEEDADALRVRTEKIRLILNKKDESFTWQDAAADRVLLEEDPKELFVRPVTRYALEGEKPIIERVKTADGERSFIQNLKPYIERNAYRAKINFRWRPGERLYGLGQGEEGVLDHRGHNQYLYQNNMRIPLPFLLSSAGWAMLADCTGLMTFNDDHNGSYWFMDTVERLDYYFIAGGAEEAIAAYRDLTGRAAMLPKWAFGYVQSKEAYRTADELLSVAREYRRRGIGLDCVVQDWNTWEPGLWGNKQPDAARYENMPEVARQLREMHVHTMISVWPNMAEGGADHAAFASQNMLLGDYSTYNAFDENARELYWRQARDGLFAKGFDAWWCDSTEPFSGPDWSGPAKREPWERYCLVGEEHKRYLDPALANAYALQHARGIFEGQYRDFPEKRVLNLTRSGYAAQQRYGVVLWSGDISASWKTLAAQIAEGLNLCMSGLPYWTLDIGGFFVVGTAWQKRGCGNHDNPNPLWFWKGEYNDGVQDKGYCELYVRWFQFGTFLPMQRSHGTDTPREIWRFGEEGTPFYDAIQKYIALRYALLPYIYSLAGRTTRAHYTMLRGLLFDFPRDEAALSQTAAFMFGPAFLVYPVIQPMYYAAESRPLEKEKTWPCYLPGDALWYNYWTDEAHEGGQTVRVDAPLDILPLFVRAGSIVPRTPGIQYANEAYEKPMQLKIYPGASGAFTLYDDSGDGYGYEGGEFAEIDFRWDDDARTLRLGARRGSYPGMPATRHFALICGKARVDALYTGQPLTVRIPSEK